MYAGPDEARPHPGLRPGAEAEPDEGSGALAGLMLSWADEVRLEDVLVAAGRQLRQRAGYDLPAGGLSDPELSLTELSLAELPLTQPFLTEPPPTESMPPAGHPVLRAGDLAGQAQLGPGPALAGWLSCASAAELDDAGLVNSVAGWRKVTSWAQAQELAGVAELARRRGISSGAGPYRTLDRQDPADFAPDELALALTLTQCSASYWMSLAVSLTGRLPRTLAALANGTIDLARAKVIDEYTTPLDDDGARKVEGKVLARAGQQTTGQLCAALRRAVISVDPAAAERRRKQAERNARVELAGEPDGTASLLGRFLPAAQASAAWARINAMATALQAGGAAGGIDLLRAQVLIRLILGLPSADPPSAHGRPTPGDPAGPRGDPPSPHGRPAPDGPAGPSGPGSGNSQSGGPAPRGPSACGGPASDPACSGPVPDGGLGGPPESSWPRLADLGSFLSTGLDPSCADTPGRDWGPDDALKARAMLTVPWGTLAAFSGEPGQLSRIGPVTPAVARELAEAARADATCEWRVVVAGARGQPLLVTRIRSPGCARAGPAHLGLLGRVIVTVPVSLLDPPHPPHPLSIPDPGTGHLAAVIRAVLEAGRAALAREPAGNAPGACTHRHMVPGYRVPGRMRAFIEARDQDCGYPVCRRPAASCDIDHTTPYDQGGLTCSCNLYPQCRRHHQLKQLPTWRLTQPRPGTLIWRTPAGLTYPAGPAPDAG